MTNDAQWLEEHGSRAMALMFRAVADAIQKIPESKSERGPEDEFALDSAQKAYFKTKKYFTTLNSNWGSSSRREEMDIAKSWETAGVMLGRYDASLKPRLSARALYWQEDGTWSPENIGRALPDLEAVHEAIASRA